MKIIYSPIHQIHNPQFEIFNGRKVPHAEKPERIEQIRRVLNRVETVQCITPKNFPLGKITKVHAEDYVRFLEKIGEDLANEDAIYPSVFGSISTKSRLAQLGRYTFDIYTPIMKKTYEAAKIAVFIALTGAQMLKEGEKLIYGLCRPPGHHAEKSRLGGYCYFNNVAVAATDLLESGARVAILDIDFHHGNGTQQIFYKTDKVLTISIHADPDRAFPYYSGFKNEMGEGKGRGFNFNYPLGKRIDGELYLIVLKEVMGKIRDYKPDYLLVSLGFDTYRNDPLGDFSLNFCDYEEIGKRIYDLGYPTLFIQEGGYNIAQIGKCAYHFFHAFLNYS